MGSAFILIFVLSFLRPCKILSTISTRTTERIALPSMSPGTHRHILIHRWGPEGSDRAYIQTSLHADEIPGLLVVNHLIRLINDADSCGQVLKQIVIVPFANPIGLDQNIFDKHIGRFSLETSTNFNRDFFNLLEQVSSDIGNSLGNNSDINVKLIRKSLLKALDNIQVHKEDAILKLSLMKLACVADVVLDLHCDSDAVMHMYMHTLLWPALSDLAAELQSQCHLLETDSGGQPFDEVLSDLWANLASKFPSFPIPMACQSTTIELRGEADVSD